MRQDWDIMPDYWMANAVNDDFDATTAAVCSPNTKCLQYAHEPE